MEYNNVANSISVEKSKGKQLKLGRRTSIMGRGNYFFCIFTIHALLFVLVTK